MPILLNADTLQPVVLATRYVIDERRETKQSSTIERDVRVLGWLYEWSKERKFDLEGRLREGKLLKPVEIRNFCRYLKALRNTKVVGGINFKGGDKISVLTPQIFNAYIGVVESFLLWAAEEFLPTVTPTDEVRETVEKAKESVRRAFYGNRVSGKTAPKMGLAKEELEALRRVIKPGAAGNPFKKSVQFRNYLIITLMLMTGIRRGELLKLKMSHLPHGPKETLTIARAPDDKGDPRRKEPQVKTLGREIPITKAFAKSLWEYALKHRRKGAHQYLFTSHRGGVPLDAGGVNWIFALLVRECFPKLKGRLHPHVMRHTFNDWLVWQARESGWTDKQCDDTQKYLNGWSDNSNMPQNYTRRVIEAQALELAEKYQNHLYSDDEVAF